MDNDQEVDVKLFITCRLCLDEPGSYQIVPCIKSQIDYCFGIEIDPFDGLPQLICKRCKGILNDYFRVKDIYLEKQNNLKSRVRIDNKVAQTVIPLKADSVKTRTTDYIVLDDDTENLAVTAEPADVSLNSSTVKSADAANIANNHEPKKRRASRNDTEKLAEVADVSLHSNEVKLADAADVANNHEPKKRRASGKTSTNVADGAPNPKKKRSSWKQAFNRYFVCTICSKSFLTEKSVKRHLPMHKKIISKHEKVFKNCLTVKLHKIDGKKNSTGSLQNLVFNEEKIICKRSNSKYHSFYLKNATTNDENENEAVKKQMALSDTSDDEIIKGKKRKSCRLYSTSSTQTVVLQENKEPDDFGNADLQSRPNGTEMDNTNCVDTSSDCPRINSKAEKKRILPMRRQPAKAEVADYKAIQNIVTMCHKNYIKKIKADGLNKSTFSESSLKHKVLSLGRKVINKQGFSCTGLLRYMEHKDLDITWTPASNEINKKNSKFVRIMTKLKSREDSENDDACWKNLHDISFYRDSGVEASVTTATATIKSEDDDPALAGAPDESNDSNYRNKLLNKNPVANPKQLPKKNLLDTKPVIIMANDATLVSPSLDSDALCSTDAVVEDCNMCQPTITSAPSLLAVSEKENQEVPSENPAPRIKVKPASELMSVRALNNQDSVEDIWTFNPIQSSLANHLANSAIPVETPMTESLSGLVSNQASTTCGPVAYQNVIQPHVKESNGREALVQSENITLDSPQFPNTKTNAPFQYFRKVLLVFGLKLLEFNEDLPQDFTCLVKFKLMLRQDSKRPIGVLLSLFCSGDTFCFNFKDTNSKMFDPHKLNAFWQWELLKIYKGSVVDKILHNAAKVGKVVHEYTKLFLCVLKSIDLVMEA